jgi:hypothetical protein
VPKKYFKIQSPYGEEYLHFCYQFNIEIKLWDKMKPNDSPWVKVSKME